MDRLYVSDCIHCRWFSNPEQLTLEEITRQLTEKLIDHQFFYPEKAGIGKFRFHRYLDDTSWYEFESVEEIKTHSRHKRLQTIHDFIYRFIPE